MTPGWQTRKLYQADEWLQEHGPVHLRRERSMAELQRLTARVWEGERQRRPMPAVVAGRGLLVGGWWSSYQQAYVDRRKASRIVLARGQRKVCVLLHELAHDMQNGGYMHGPAFRRIYFHLLVTYGGMDPIELLNFRLGAGV